MQGERRGRRGAKANSGDARELGDPPAFEAALEQLDRIVEQLENGQIPLDEALALFERGVWLAQRCQETLDSAELRVQRLREAALDTGALGGGAGYVVETFELDQG